MKMIWMFIRLYTFNNVVNHIYHASLILYKYFLVYEEYRIFKLNFNRQIYIT